MAGDFSMHTAEITPLQQAAIAMRETFLAMKAAGFTDRQALTFLAESTRHTSGD